MVLQALLYLISLLCAAPALGSQTTLTTSLPPEMEKAYWPMLEFEDPGVLASRPTYEKKLLNQISKLGDSPRDAHAKAFIAMYLLSAYGLYYLNRIEIHDLKIPGMEKENRTSLILLKRCRLALKLLTEAENILPNHSAIPTFRKITQARLEGFETLAPVIRKKGDGPIPGLELQDLLLEKGQIELSTFYAISREAEKNPGPGLSTIVSVQDEIPFNRDERLKLLKQMKDLRAKAGVNADGTPKKFSNAPYTIIATTTAIGDFIFKLGLDFYDSSEESSWVNRRLLPFLGFYMIRQAGGIYQLALATTKADKSLKSWDYLQQIEERKNLTDQFDYFLGASPKPALDYFNSKKGSQPFQCASCH